MRASKAVLSLAMVALLIAIPLLSPLPFTLALIVDMVIIIVAVVVDGLRNRILFSMAMRNMVRKRSLTVLVVAGLMIGTAIISASFVVGDSMQNMMDQQITEGFGEMDFEAIAYDGVEVEYIDDATMGHIADNVSGIENVRAVATPLMAFPTVFNQDESLFTSSVRTMAFDPGSIDDFGGLVTVDGESLHEPPVDGEAYVNEHLASNIDAKVGDTLVIYSESPQPTIVTVVALVQDAGLGILGSGDNIFVSRGDAGAIAGHPGTSNRVLVSMVPSGADGLGHHDQVREDLESVLDGTGYDFEITSDQKEWLDEGRASMSMLTDLLLVFSSFAIISGVALIVNIFTMLGEERKSEMGMARAIGMTRTRLKRTYIYEGTFYAIVAAFIGTLVGVAIAYVIIMAVGGVFDFGVPAGSFFTFTLESLALSCVAGFMLTLGTVYLTTGRISNLNIVRAIRDIPEPPPSKDDRRTFRLGILGMALGAVVMVAGVVMGSQAPAIVGLCAITLSSGFVLRRYVSERAAWNVAALLTILPWLPTVNIFPYEGGIEMFVLSGIFTVTAALMLVMFNSDWIVWAFTSLFRTKREYRAVLLTAFSYPLKARFKTALSIFIFALIIFTITVLSIMTGMVSLTITETVEETSGGLQVIGFSYPSPYLEDIPAYLDEMGEYCSGDNISMSIPLVAQSVMMEYTLENGSDASRGYSALGIGQDFIDGTEYTLNSYNETLYGNEREAWQAVYDDTEKAIIDGTWAPQDDMYMSMGGMGGGGDDIGVGDTVALVVGGEWHNVTVVGIMDQTILTGIYVGKPMMTSAFNVTDPSVFLINFQDGLDPTEQSKLLERDLFPFGMQTLSVSDLADQIVQGVSSVFTLFRAFIAIGLVIGLSGLGIITIRSIHERRIEIGMMRAIGYRRRMVVANFALESVFVALLGVLIGVIMGVMVGYIIYLETFSGVAFTVPWLEMLLISVGVLVATSVCILPAARGASKVSPSEALRFE